MDICRGKAINTGIWLIGSAICINDRAFLLSTSNLEAERPEYNGMAMGCGLEDKGYTKNGYLAMEYGWEEALDRYEENFPLWEELDPDTVTRCCEKHDMIGNVIFEGDVIRSPEGILYEICYGKYMVFYPVDKSWRETVGFFMLSKDEADITGVKECIPLGQTEEYAVVVGNIFDNKNLIQHTYFECDNEPEEQVLMPAT